MIKGSEPGLDQLLEYGLKKNKKKRIMSKHTFRKENAWTQPSTIENPLPQSKHEKGKGAKPESEENGKGEPYGGRVSKTIEQAESKKPMCARKGR